MEELLKELIEQQKQTNLLLTDLNKKLAVEREDGTLINITDVVDEIADLCDENSQQIQKIIEFQASAMQYAMQATGKGQND